MTDFWKESPALEARLRRVAAIVDGIAGSRGFPLGEAVASAARAGGKLLRPALMIIGSGFGKAAEPDRLERLAAAVELLHVATLVHDDIIDESPVRRGSPSLHACVGVKEAVLAGDWLFSRCFLLASEAAEPENARGLARLIAAVCSAEIEQDLGRYRYSPSVREYLRTIAGKTAALFSLSLYAGASEAKAPPAAAQALRRAGYDIGMAFQVIDDILDFEAEEETLRKPVGKDIAEGLCTLPLVYALAADEAGMRPLLASRDEGWAGRAAARAVELGGVERARADARRFTGRALAELGRLRPGPARGELELLTKRLLDRSY